MTKPEEFRLTTDYATLKNDAVGTLTVTLPSSVNIPASTVYSLTDTISIGVIGASVRSRISTTKDNIVYYGSFLGQTYTSGATLGGSPLGYDIFALVHRISPTQVRLSIMIPNPYGTDPLIVSSLAQTFTARVATFLPPYS